MAEMTIPEAAAVLGVSVATIRRRVQQGDLPARQDARGRYLVTVDTAAAGSGHSPQATATELAQLRLELKHTQELLAEVRRQRDELAILLDAQRAQMEAVYEAQARADEERAELRRLLGNAQMQLSALLPVPHHGEGGPEERAARLSADGQTQKRRRRWWWPWG